MEKKQLLLGDVLGMSDLEVREHITAAFSISESELEPYTVIMASQDEQDYEGSFYILLKHKESGEFFEVSGSHCSCYYYEDQFETKLAPIQYLLSEKHYYCPGDKKVVQNFLREILGENIEGLSQGTE